MLLGTYLRLSLLSVDLLLGAVAFRRHSRSATHVFLGLLTIVVFLWGIANEFFVNAITIESTLMWARVVMLLAVPVSMFFFLLMYTFPRVTLSVNKAILVIFVILAAIGMSVAASPYFFTGIVQGVGETAELILGPGMLVLLVTTVVPTFLGVIALLQKNWKLKRIEKLQARYLLLGTVVMYGLIFSLILVPIAINRSSSYIAYAPLFTLPFVITTTYAIVRYRLIDIRLALFRGLSLTILVSGVVGIYALLIIFLVPLISHITGISNDFLAVAAALISVPIARFIIGILTRVTDQFLFQTRVDYRKALVRIAQNLSSTIQIDEVTEIVLGAIADVLRSSKAIILLRDEDGDEYVPHGKHGAQSFNLTIPESNPLIKHLRHVPMPVVYDELMILKERLQTLEHKEEMEEIENSLSWLDVSVVVPLFVNRELTGVLLLGEKLSGQPYMQDDIEFLSALAPQAATSLENTRLYKQSLEFGQTLRRDIEAATRELEMANQQLKELDKTKSEFLSIASHQLYTPLTALRGYISMLVEGDFGPIAEKQQPILDILNKSCNRLIELIKDLLDVSRIESGRLELNLQSIDLGKMANELVRDLLPNALNKGLKMTYEPPRQPLPHVMADEQHIRQVMLNFIDNAIKYTANGWVKVMLAQEGQEIVFSVIDTGKGLSQMDISRLFTKFTRVGGSSRFHTEGTGLGLYVARQIVKEHHGEVMADSLGQNQGSTFTMRLPIEGALKSLKIGDRTSVVIKAAEATGTTS